MPLQRKCILCRRGVSAETTLFSFPARTDQRSIWAKFCDKTVDEIKKTWRICSNHFKPNSFIAIRLGKKLTLKDGAVPTVKSFVAPEIQGQCTATSDYTQKIHKYEKRDKMNKTTSYYCCICGKVEARKLRRFPANPALKYEWAQSLRLNEDDLKDWFRVCSIHFPDGDSQVPVLLQPNTSSTTINENQPVEFDDYDATAHVEVVMESESCPVKTEIENSPVHDDLHEICHQNLVSSTDVISNKSENLINEFDTITASTSRSTSQSCVKAETLDSVKLEPSEPCLNDTIDENIADISSTSIDTEDRCVSPVEIQARAVGNFSKKYLWYLGDISNPDFEIPKGAKLCVPIASKTVQSYNEKISSLKQKYSQTLNKLDSIEATLKELRDKQLLPDQAAYALQVFFPSIV